MSIWEDVTAVGGVSLKQVKGFWGSSHNLMGQLELHEFIPHAEEYFSGLFSQHANISGISQSISKAMHAESAVSQAIQDIRAMNPLGRGA